MKHRLALFSLVLLAGCSKLPAAHPDAVLITLAPDVVSSQDATLHARATVVEGHTPLRGWRVVLSAQYTDRNGNDRALIGAAGRTDQTGALDYTFSGLAWEGAGTITAVVVKDSSDAPVLTAGANVQSTASFSVVDLSPPVATILDPTSDLKVGPGLPVDVQVQITDEIGVSQVTFEADSPDFVSTQSTIIASGATSATVTFSFDVPDFALSGPTITLHALAEDLSGNIAAATALTLTVDPAVRIAVPPGMTGTNLALTGLANPVAMAWSPRDGKLYVTDATGGGTCGGGCVKQVDPANGNVTTTAVVGIAGITGLAFDATGDNLYVAASENPPLGGAAAAVSHVVQSAFGVTAYGAAAACSLATPANRPQDALHLLVDATTLYVVDGNAGAQNVKKLALPCNGTQDFTNLNGGGAYNSPIGITRIPAGDLLVSDNNGGGGGNGVIESTNITTGALTPFEFGAVSRPLGRPIGLDWLAGGPNATFADSAFAASCNIRRVVATRGSFSTRAAAFLRDNPIDVAFDGNTAGTLYILTGDPGGNFCNGNNGSSTVLKVTGY